MGFAVATLCMVLIVYIMHLGVVRGSGQELLAAESIVANGGTNDQ